MVKKYLGTKNVDYKELQAEGEEYEQLANLYGFTVPLVVNGDRGMVGYNISQLKQLITE